MKRFATFGIITALAGAMAIGTAFAGPIEMVITSGGQSSTLLVGTGDPSSVAVSALSNTSLTLNNWTISNQTGGTSYSPFLNQLVGLDLAGYAVTCSGQTGTGCSQDPLTVAVSATGFTSPVAKNGFLLEFSGNANGGMANTTAYFDSLNSGNNYFCNDTGSTTLNDYCGSSNMIGSLSLTGKSSGTTMIGGPQNLQSYSLTIVDTFAANSAGDPSYSVDTTVLQTPEPGALALFGAGLLGCAVFVNRRRASRRS